MGPWRSPSSSHGQGHLPLDQVVEFRGAGVQNWGGQGGLGTILWIRGKPAEMWCLLGCFLLVQGTQGQIESGEVWPDQSVYPREENWSVCSSDKFPWQGIWEAAGRAVRVFPVQELPRAQGRTSTWDRSDKGCASHHWPGTATLPNTKLTFTSHIFCSLILSSGSCSPEKFLCKSQPLILSLQLLYQCSQGCGRAKGSPAKPPALRWECQVSSGEKAETLLKKSLTQWSWAHGKDKKDPNLLLK